METVEQTPYIQESGRLQFGYHPGQKRAMASEARFILLLAGLQSGKTIFGPWWMLREMQRKGPGDYLVATPTYPLLDVKCLPEYKDLFERRMQLGEYVGSPNRRLTLTARGEQVLFGSVQEQDTRILFGHAQDPDSLESATVKAAHLDEAGQEKFKYGSWDAIQGRLSIHQGRALITTTPYYMGWLKSELYDRAEGNPEIEVIQFDSTENPAFPQEEFDRQQERLPGWKFRMRYRGMFERPAGMIYDCWDKERHTIPRHRIGSDWPRYLGLDFGGTNTVGTYLARKPGTQRYVLYRAYHEGGRTAEQHAQKMRGGGAEMVAPGTFEDIRGGSGSENQWRSEFRAGGLPVQEPPIDDVEVGIDRVYAMLKATIEGRVSDSHLVVFDDCASVIDEIESYQRKLDDQDEPTDEIKNKSDYHRLDGLRYICASIRHDEQLPDAPRSRQY
jgi:hypothetical protein